MRSPPSTPSPNPEHPLDGSSRFTDPRFLDTENAERYRPGGYHPINLGDTFSEGRYKVMRKLGKGVDSTVWLALSASQPRYVALKVMTASASAKANLSILDVLKERAKNDPNSRYVALCLDSFWHVGVNGAHLCLVMAPMGDSAAGILDTLAEKRFAKIGNPLDDPDIEKVDSDWRARNESLRKTIPVMDLLQIDECNDYSPWLAKRILYQVLHGLAFLHQNGVIHGDLNAGNILFSIEDIDHVDEVHLRQCKRPSTILRKDGKLDKWAPKSLWGVEPLWDRIRVGEGLQVKIADLQSALWYKSTVGPTESLRAPEIILHKTFDFGIDIWTFGCLLFEFLTGEQLIPLWWYEKNEMTDESLYQLHMTIGPLPRSIMANWVAAEKYLTPEGRSRDTDFKDPEPKMLHGKEQLRGDENLEGRFMKRKHESIGKEEGEMICSLLRQALEYDPSKRATAEQLLAHPWFADQVGPS